MLQKKRRASIHDLGNNSKKLKLPALSQIESELQLELTERLLEKNHAIDDDIQCNWTEMDEQMFCLQQEPDVSFNIHFDTNLTQDKDAKTKTEGVQLEAREWLRQNELPNSEEWKKKLSIPSFPSIVPNLVKLSDSKSFYLPLEQQTPLRRRHNGFNLWRQYVSVCLMMTRARHYVLVDIPEYYSTTYDKESYMRFCAYFYPKELVESETGITTKQLNRVRQLLTTRCRWKPTELALKRNQSRGITKILFLFTTQKVVAKESDSYPEAPTVTYKLVTSEINTKSTSETLDKYKHYIIVYPEEIPLNFGKVCHRHMEMSVKGHVKPIINTKIELFGRSDTLEDPYERSIVPFHLFLEENQIRSVEHTRRLNRLGLMKMLHTDPIVRLHGFEFVGHDIIGVSERDFCGTSTMYYCVRFDDSKHSSKKDRNSATIGSGGMVSVPPVKKQKETESG